MDDVPKPTLWCAPWDKEVQVREPYTSPEEEVDADVLWDRIVTAWPDLEGKTVKVTIGPSPTGIYTILRFKHNKNGRLRTTIWSSTREG